MFGFDKYPRKRLTAAQTRENRQHAVRTGRAQAEYERGKEELRERLAKKWGVTWEAELEGDWEVVDRFYKPHVAPVDEDALTPEQRKSWELDKQMADTMRKFYERTLFDHAAMLERITTDHLAYEGKTVKWVRYGDDLTTRSKSKSEGRE